MVSAGDCISSLSCEYGHRWTTIWEHPENAELRSLRTNHNILLPGDRVFIPDRTCKWELAPTERRHRFRRRGVPAFFQLRVMLGEQPMGRTRFRLTVDGRHCAGKTDENGYITAQVEPTAQVGLLAVGEPGCEFIIRVQLRHLDPIDSVTGRQQRLSNLGFSVPVTGVADDATSAALREFQQKTGLEITGQFDTATRSELESRHAC